MLNSHTVWQRCVDPPYFYVHMPVKLVRYPSQPMNIWTRSEIGNTSNDAFTTTILLERVRKPFLQKDCTSVRRIGYLDKAARLHWEDEATPQSEECQHEIRACHITTGQRDRLCRFESYIPQNKTTTPAESTFWPYTFFSISAKHPARCRWRKYHRDVAFKCVVAYITRQLMAIVE